MRISPIAALLAPLAIAKVRPMADAIPTEAPPARPLAQQGIALTSLDMLVALSALRGAAVPSRTQAIKRMTRGLSLLADLEAAYLDEAKATPTMVADLRDWLAQEDDATPDDAELAALHEEMMLRVRVEIAKLDRSV